MTDLRLNQTVIDKFGKLQKKKKITSSLKKKICYRSEILFTPLCTLPSVFFCFFGNVSYSNQVILNLRHLSWEDCTKSLASSHYKTEGTKPMLLKLTEFWPKYRQNRQVTNVPELKIQGVKRLLSQIIHDKKKRRHQKTSQTGIQSTREYMYNKVQEFPKLLSINFRHIWKSPFGEIGEKTTTYPTRLKSEES